MTRKTYHYKNLSFPIADNTDVEFTVEFVSDGNIGQTQINIPGPNDSSISDSGSKVIGKGKDLRAETTFCFSDIINPVPKEDKIIIRYKINGQLLIEHENDKSEENRPYIVLFIKFPAS